MRRTDRAHVAGRRACGTRAEPARPDGEVAGAGACQGEREATSPIERGPAPSWSQRAEHRTSSDGRLTSPLLTPLLAVVPWLMMMGAIVLLARSMTNYRVTFERGWGEIVGGTVAAGARRWGRRRV